RTPAVGVTGAGSPRHRCDRFLLGLRRRVPRGEGGAGALPGAGRAQHGGRRRGCDAPGPARGGGAAARRAPSALDGAARGRRGVGTITSEDDALLPLAERVLSHEDDAALERAFVEIEDRTVGRAGCEALVSLAGAVAHAATTLAMEAATARPDILAREVMRSRPATVRPDESLARAAELMKSLGIRELPVVMDRA